MKVHKITLYVVDHEGLGGSEVASTITNTRYPNDCIGPNVLSVETADIGAWSDEHPLNQRDKAKAEIDRLFSGDDFPLGKACDPSGEGSCESCQ